MASMLTFQPGRVPGIADASSSNRQVAEPMTSRQRAALSALIHVPAGTRNSYWQRLDRGTDAFWSVIVALSLVIGTYALFDGARALSSSSVLQVAQAEKRVTTAAATPHVDAPRKSARQSSGPLIRTM